MGEDKATPRPWETELGWDGDRQRLFVTVGGHDGWRPWTDEDAVFIVRAVNAHADLLAACEYVADMLRQEFPDGFGGTETAAAKLTAVGGAMSLRMVTEAIAKAKGTPA